MNNTITQPDLPLPQPGAAPDRGWQDGSGSPLPWTVDARHDVPGGLAYLLSTFGPTTLTAIHPDTERIRGRYLDEATLTAETIWAGDKNAHGWNLYFCPNEPKPGLSKKPARIDIVRIRCAAFADIDGKNGRTLDDALAQVRRLPQPDVVIASGGGFQPIWLLPEPLPATVENIARVEARSERIALATGGDPVQDVCRILRVPFTMNYPNKGKRAAGRNPCPSGLVIMEGRA